MSIYIIVFLLLSLSVFIESFGDKISAAVLLIGSLVLLLFITCNREGIGADFYSYKEIYHDVTINDSYTVEFGFVILNYIAYYLGGFKILLLITASLNLISIIFVLRRFKLNISMGVLTYYSVFYLNHNFNVIRHGLMSSLVWVSFYFFFERKTIKSFFFYFLSFLFHKLALLFYPLQFLTTKRVNFKYSIILSVVLFIIGECLKEFFLILNIYISQFSSKLDYYLNEYNNGEEVVKYKFGLGFFLYVIIYFIILLFDKYFVDRKQIVFFNRLLFVSIQMTILFASLSVFSERIANVLLMSLVFIFASIDKIEIGNFKRYMLLIVFIAINIFYLIKILNIPGAERPYQFVPYTYSFF